MAFIKAQKLVYDEEGQIVSGSASIVDTQYGNYGTYHAKHTVREKLGKVLYLSQDKKTGIFLSPTRGLIEYSSTTDSFQDVEKNDPRIRTGILFPEAEIHTVFGDSYLLLNFLKKAGLVDILRQVFPKNTDYERVLCHILHGILKDGSKISCDNFIEKSFASYITADVPLYSLRSDTNYFSMMGQDHIRLSFFRSFVEMMRRSNPNFGKGCYVDSTPLPNDIDGMPFNALCCHGVSSSQVMMRLALVLDEETGLPVWYDIIPGNVLDINTIMTVMNDVAVSLDIEIQSLVLDAGYVSKELLETFHIGSEKTIVGRMPARRGYPFKELYWGTKDLLGRGKYSFVRNGHLYFGKRKEISLFGQKEFAYIYVDHYNALKRYREYLMNHEEEYAALRDSEKDWYAVKSGFFILVSNILTTPAELLSQYFTRTNVETVFKTSKEYLDLLPLSKWTDETIRGKILHDILDTIILLLLRKRLSHAGISVSELFGKLQSLMCVRSRSGLVTVETPSKKVKEYFSLFDLPIPAHLELPDFSTSTLALHV